MTCRRVIQIPMVVLQRLPLQRHTAASFCTHILTKQTKPARPNLCQCVSTHAQLCSDKPNLYLRIRRKLGFMDYPVGFYRAMAVFLYEKIDKVGIEDFFREFQLEDTFYSWFLAMELHLWMLLSRASRHGKEGKVLKETMSTTMWDDVGRKIKLISSLPRSEHKKTLGKLHDEMTFALVLYDEAILCDDKRLAEAIWIRLYRGNEVDPRILEKAVFYVRKQVLHLDMIPTEDFVMKGMASWVPLRNCQP